MTSFANSNALNRAKIGVIAQTVGQLLVGLLGIVLVKIMTTHLDSNEYGIYSTTFALVGTFALFTNLGINTVTLREIAKFPNKASAVIGHNIGLRLAVCLIAIPLISLIGFLFYPQASHDFRIAILLMSSYLIFDAVWSTCIVYFSAKVRNDITSAVMVIQQLAFLLFVVLAVISKQGLLAYVMAYVSSFAVTALAAYTLTGKHIRIRPMVNLRIWRQTIGISIVLGIINALEQIYHMADSIMLSVLGSISQVGIYTVAYSLVGIFLYVPGYIMINLMPIIIKTKDESELRQLIQNSFYLLACTGMLIPIISYFLGKDMVLFVSNKHYASAALPFFILTIGTMFSYIAATFISTSIALSKQKGLLLIALATLVLNIAINLFAIPRYGLIGAATATAITELFSLFAIIIQFKRYTKININTFSAFRPIIAASLSFLVLINIDKFWATKIMIFNLVVGAIIICVVYAFFLFVIRGMPPVITQSISDFLSKCQQLIYPTNIPGVKK